MYAQRLGFLGDATGMVLTQDLANSIIATRGSEWTQKEIDFLTAQLSQRIGQTFVANDYGDWTFPDGTGISTRAAGANNFSLASNDPETDIENAFIDTYGNQLNVNYGRWVQSANGSWSDPQTPGSFLADNMYHALVHIQQVLQQAWNAKRFDGIQQTIQGILDAAQAAAVPLPVAVAQRPRAIINGVEVYTDDGSIVPGGYNAIDDENRQLSAQGGGVNSQGQYVAPDPTAVLDPTTVDDPVLDAAAGGLPAGRPVAVVPAPSNNTPTTVTTTPVQLSPGAIDGAASAAGGVLSNPWVLAGAVLVGGYAISKLSTGRR